MNKAVVDASVAAKWVLPNERETFVEQAMELLSGHTRGETRLIVPDLFWPEIGSILWKASRRGHITRQQATASLHTMSELGLTTYSSQPILLDAYEIASAFGRTVYDSLYVSLAVQMSVPLVTADEKLANALAAYFPVRWLAAW